MSRETKLLLLTLLAVSAAGGAAGYLVCGAAGALCALMTGLLCCAVCLTVSLHRMREIHRLCDYLAQVYAGDRFLDIRTQREGELSLLRNELYKVTAILWEQKECLSRDRQQMADFLGDVAHQLRTPLAAIVLQTELWQDAAVSQTEKTECAARIQQAAERMGWLVEQLLQLCRLDAKVVRFHAQEHAARQLLREAARGLAPLCAAKNVSLECMADDGVQCRCDAAWTVQALTNLIKNAAEHTPAGGRVRLLCEANALFTQFCVENTGPLLSAQEIPHLFERFWRGKDAAPDSIGIGLLLAKAIAEGQGGTLWAENGPDGPRFLLRIYRT